jgi:hypothetical protein
MNYPENSMNPQRQNRMSVNRLFPSILIILLSLFIMGCNNDNNEDDTNKETPTTVAEDKANIQASFDRTKNLLENFKDGSFYKFADQFIDYKEEYVEQLYSYYYQVGDGNGDYSYNENTGEYEHTPGTGNYNYEQYSYGYYDDVISEFAEMLGEKLEDVIDFDEIADNNRFNFARLAGNYVWDKNDSIWNKTSNNTVLVSFPSSAAKENNDCEAAITAYEDNSYNIEGKTVYLPTKANIYFKKDGAKLFSADLTAKFSDNGIPKQITANVYAKPLTFDLSLAQESSTKFKADLNIVSETKSENNLRINCEATLSNGLTQYSDFDDMELTVLKFTVTQHELSIIGTVDFKTLDDLNKTAENINACTNFEVLYKTQKTGTLKVVDLDDNKYLYIVYKDGTQENTSIYYDSFIEDIKKIFEKYLD